MARREMPESVHDQVHRYLDLAGAVDMTKASAAIFPPGRSSSWFVGTGCVMFPLMVLFWTVKGTVLAVRVTALVVVIFVKCAAVALWLTCAALVWTTWWVGAVRKDRAVRSAEKTPRPVPSPWSPTMLPKDLARQSCPPEPRRSQRWAGRRLPWRSRSRPST